MKPPCDFAAKFNTSLSFDESLIVRKQSRFFLLKENLKQLVSEEFFYAGTYLGKLKNGRFFSSFALLSMIGEREANKIIIDEKSEWLFICGRDIFRQGIVEIRGSRRKGDYTLILNKHSECLGFGRIRNLDEGKQGQQIAVKNVSDIGDFLRREKRD